MSDNLFTPEHPAENAALLARFPFPNLQTIIIAAGILGCFGFSLFFGGYQDILYAPAIICLMVSAIAAFAPIKRKALILPGGPVALTLFAFWSVITLSLSWSSVPYASLVTWLVLLPAPFGFFVMLTAPQRETLLRLLGVGMLAALCLLAAWAIIQYWAPGGAYEGRAHLPLPNPNSLGALLALAIPPVLAGFMLAHHKDTPAPKIAKIVLPVAFLLLLAGVLATESRGALIALSIADIVLLFISRASLGAEESRKPLFMLGGGAVIVIALMNITGPHGIISRLFHSFSAGNIGSSGGAVNEWQERLNIWHSALRMVQDAPFLGRGLGTFYLYYPSYSIPGDRSAGSWAHMDSLQLWTEIGILGPLAYYGIMIAVLFVTLKALNKTPKDSLTRLALGGSFSGLLVVAIQSHVTFLLYLMPVMLCCALLLAGLHLFAAHALADDPHAENIEDRSTQFWITQPLSGWQKPAAAATIFTSFILIGALALSCAAGAYFTLRAREAISQNNVNSFIANIERAEAYGPPSFIDPKVQLAGLYADIAHTAPYLNTPDEQKKLVKDTQDMLDTAEYYNPAWAGIDHKRAQFYSKISTNLVPNARQLAEQNWITALAKNPQHIRARTALAAFYVSQGRVRKAYDLVNNGLAYFLPPQGRKTLETMRDQLQPLIRIQGQISEKANKSSGSSSKGKSR